ncbi:helix-turn-helix domain-containing protein [Halobellus litoreus]|uniref:Helix-turn-helix domain-containing protein n=1 Tax=Halobellus litoreus TaxID=755310 RepID=A0ABD6DS29_9EURY|nr:helix-turn-helix domain-containing protein [Halobellus litoreus]
MSPDDHTDESDGSRIDFEDAIEGVDEDADAEGGPRARLEAEADRAVSEFDEGIVDLLAWLLDTETRARIYVYLRKNPHSTSEEVADGTGLYPSTVREALAELHEEETVERRKRESAGAGNNPYEYTAIAPSDLVRGVAEQVQAELNTVFNLDSRLGGSEDAEEGGDTGPVSITVDEAGDDAGGDEDGAPESDSGTDGSTEADADDETSG